MDISGGISLTDLPLIGSMLPDDALMLEDLKIIVASDDLNANEVNVVNQLIQDFPLGMKVQSLPTSIGGGKDILITKGVSLVAKFKIGSEEVYINIPVIGDSQTEPTESSSSTMAVITSPSTSSAVSSIDR